MHHAVRTLAMSVMPCCSWYSSACTVRARAAQGGQPGGCQELGGTGRGAGAAMQQQTLAQAACGACIQGEPECHQQCHAQRASPVPPVQQTTQCPAHHVHINLLHVLLQLGRQLGLSDLAGPHAIDHLATHGGAGTARLKLHSAMHRPVCSLRKVSAAQHMPMQLCREAAMAYHPLHSQGPHLCMVWLQPPPLGCNGGGSRGAAWRAQPACNAALRGAAAAPRVPFIH